MTHRDLLNQDGGFDLVDALCEDIIKSVGQALSVKRHRVEPVVMEARKRARAKDGGTLQYIRVSEPGALAKRDRLIRERIDDGQRVEQVAAEFKVSRRTVYRVVREGLDGE